MRLKDNDYSVFLAPAMETTVFDTKDGPFPLGQYINGNASVTIYSDGTKARLISGSEFHPRFAENIDIKLTNKCIGTNCAFCHEGSGPKGKSINAIPAFMFDLHPFQEVALGGGNIFDMDYDLLTNILATLADKNVVSNITVNQMHFESNYDKIAKYCECRIVHGVGVSLVTPNNKFIYDVRRMPNAVVHVIAGLVTKDQLEAMRNCGIKILILGYKTIRRGNDYYSKNSEKIKSNIDWLSKNILDMKDWFDVISFDNLALDQLGIKSKVDEKTWESRYMGDDGTSTFFIDCVEKQYAKSSTTPIEERKSASASGKYGNLLMRQTPSWNTLFFKKGTEPKIDMDWVSVDDMFKDITENNGGTGDAKASKLLL
jgi:hypothetical protein